MLKKLTLISAMIVFLCSSSHAISPLSSTIDSLKDLNDGCTEYIDNNEMIITAGASIYKAHYDFRESAMEVKSLSIKSNLDPTFRLENGGIYKIVMSINSGF